MASRCDRREGVIGVMQHAEELVTAPAFARDIESMQRALETCRPHDERNPHDRCISVVGSPSTAIRSARYPPQVFQSSCRVQCSAANDVAEMIASIGFFPPCRTRSTSSSALRPWPATRPIPSPVQSCRRDCLPDHRRIEAHRVLHRRETLSV